jgi:hypothetical protein
MNGYLAIASGIVAVGVAAWVVPPLPTFSTRPVEYALPLAMDSEFKLQTTSEVSPELYSPREFVAVREDLRQESSSVSSEMVYPAGYFLPASVSDWAKY